MGNTTVSLGLAFSVLLFSSIHSVASAQPNQSNDELARAHFQLGTAHYESGTFLKAAAEFEEAYRISQRPQLLYNIYLAYRDANEPRKAADALREYLNLVQDASNRAQLEAKLKALERGLAEAEARQAAGDQSPVSIEVGESDEDPLPATEAASPPSTTAELQTDSGGGGSRILPIVLMATGGALIVGGLVTGLMTASAQGKLEDACTEARNCVQENPAATRDLESTHARGKTLAVVTDVLWITGLAAAGTGAVLFLLSGNKERATASTTAPRASFGCAPGVCSGAVRLSF